MMHLYHPRVGDSRQAHGIDGALVVVQRSADVPADNTTLSYAVATGSSKQSAAITADHVVIYSDVDVWCAQGANPSAVAPVADTSAGSMRLNGGELYRVRVATSGNKFAFRAVTADGTVEITPAA